MVVALGGKKQNKVKEAGSDAKASAVKELKIVATQVITKEKVLQTPRLIALLYLIKRFGAVHERTLQFIMNYLQEKGAELGYQFTRLGNDPYSPSLKNDIVALLYTGLAEAEPRYRKIRVTSDGREVLESISVPSSFKELLETNFSEIKSKASMIDAEIDFEIRKSNKLLKKR